MLTYGSSIAISRSSAVSLTVSLTGASLEIDANMRFSATLKTGCPHGSSSYASGKDRASSRIRAAIRCGLTGPFWRLRLVLQGTKPASPKARKGVSDALQERQREEREAVREAEGEGDVEVPRGEDRQLAGLVVPGRQGVVLELLELPLELEAGRDDRAEEGCRPQGRQSHGAQEELDRVRLDTFAEAERLRVLVLPRRVTLGGGAFPALVEEDDEPDRALEQHEQRDHLEHRRHRVDAREDDGERRHEHVAEPPVPAELLRRQDPDSRQREDEHRQLEDERGGDHDGRDEREVALRA